MLKSILNKLTGKHVIYVNRIDLIAVLVNIKGSRLAEEVELDVDQLILELVASEFSDDGKQNRLMKVTLDELRKYDILSLIKLIELIVRVGGDDLDRTKTYPLTVGTPKWITAHEIAEGLKLRGIGDTSIVLEGHNFLRNQSKFMPLTKITL